MKKRIYYDYRLTVWPGAWFSRIPGDKSDCEDILEQIQRHVNGIKQVNIEFTTKDICEFCKSKWEQDENGQPVCCNKAVEEWDRLKSESIPSLKVSDTK